MSSVPLLVLSILCAGSANANQSSPKKDPLSILSDDRAGFVAWTEACRALATPNSVKFDAKATTSEQIIDLIKKRAVETAKLRNGEWQDIHRCAASLRMGHVLAIVAPRSSGPTLSEITRLALESIAGWKEFPGHPLILVAEPFARVTTDRIQQGDRSAILEYQQILEKLVPDASMPLGAFRPFWSAPENEKLQAILGKLMRAQTAKLTSIDVQTAIHTTDFFFNVALYSPLITLHSYRQMLVAGLRNESPAGDAWLRPCQNGYLISFGYAGGLDGAYGLTGAKPDIAINSHVSVSIGDHLAQRLTSLQGTPPFCMLLPESQRRSQREALINWFLDDSRSWLTFIRESPFYRESLGTD